MFVRSFVQSIKSMAPPPSKFNRAYDDKEAPPSSNLWVGNLSADTTDADLKELFGKFGALDKVTTYSSRSFAFVYFKRVEDAKAAKDALQGSDFRGNPIKIEFARPHFGILQFLRSWAI